MRVKQDVSAIRHYFVDEAGDGNLFNRKGHVLLGTPGCSAFFILGVLDVKDPEGLDRDLGRLRARLLADPYFAGVPSMQPEGRKTAVAFHAKDDVPEVRREVFSLLLQQELRFMAVVQQKSKVLDYVRQRNERDPSYRYAPNELYDYLLRRLFKNLLHKDERYVVTFAERGRADRTAALREALTTARDRFCQAKGITAKPPVDVVPSSSTRSPGLQAADYLLWALQRFYERHEERYLLLMWPKFRLVHDVDDTRQAQYGAYFSQQKPLNLEAVKGRLGI